MFIVWGHSPAPFAILVNVIIEYGHEAKPSILGLQVFFLAARRDYGDGGDYGAR